jgi:hypothetical protein
MTRRKVVMVKASTDKTVPKTKAGDLEPNYYCRAWNGKREKYCKARAGARTDHVGLGRCWVHGGMSQNAAAMKHGKHAKIATPAMRQAIELAEKLSNPLDMIPTLARARGVLEYAIDNYDRSKSDIALSDLTRAIDTASKVAYRIEQTRGMIPKDRVRLFMLQLAEILNSDVKDEHLRARLLAKIDGIRA